MKKQNKNLGLKYLKIDLNIEFHKENCIKKVLKYFNKSKKLCKKLFRNKKKVFEKVLNERALKKGGHPNNHGP